MNETAHRLLPRTTKKWAGLLLTSFFVVVGCSDNPAPPPKAFTLIESAGGPLCKFSGPWLLIGTNQGTADAGPKSVEDGATASDGGAVHVSCRVSQSGDDIDFEADVRKERDPGGTMKISGKVKANVTTPQAPIQGGFSPNDSGSYLDENCSLTVTGVAGGRIMGNIDCGQAKREGSKVGESTETCRIHGDFKLENCSQ
jgi:hypothetical protein